MQIGRNPMQRLEKEAEIVLDPVTDIVALLEAAKGSSLQTLDFSGVTFTLKMAAKVKEVIEENPSLAIIYGGTGGYLETKPRLPPLEKLVKYAASKKVVLIDLFKLFDQLGTGYLSEERFQEALKVSWSSGHSIQITISQYVSP